MEHCGGSFRWHRSVPADRGGRCSCSSGGWLRCSSRTFARRTHTPWAHRSSVRSQARTRDTRQARAEWVSRNAVHLSRPGVKPSRRAWRANQTMAQLELKELKRIWENLGTPRCGELGFHDPPRHAFVGSRRPRSGGRNDSSHSHDSSHALD